MGNVNSVRKVKAPELPLILEAARDGHRDKVRVFLRHEHDVNATCRFGVTPLMASALNGHYDVTQLLLKKGADVNMHCADGTTALMAAILDRHLHLVHLLLSNGACVNMARKDGVTALMTSAVCGDERITEALLRKGVANVDAQNRAKQTALILAAKHNHVAVAEMLLRHGACPRLKDSASCTALMHATHRAEDPNPELVRLLLQGTSDKVTTAANYDRDQATSSQSRDAPNDDEIVYVNEVVMDRPAVDNVPPLSIQNHTLPDFSVLVDVSSNASSDNTKLKFRCLREGDDPNNTDLAASDHKAPNEQITKLKQHAEVNQGQFSELETEREAHEQNVSEYREQVNTSAEQIANLQCQIETLEMALRKQRKEYTELNAQLATEKDSNAEAMIQLSAKLDDMRHKHEADRAQLELERNRLESDLERATTKLNQYKALASMPHYENFDFVRAQQSIESGIGSLASSQTEATIRKTVAPSSDTSSNRDDVFPSPSAAHIRTINRHPGPNGCRVASPINIHVNVNGNPMYSSVESLSMRTTDSLPSNSTNSPRLLRLQPPDRFEKLLRNLSKTIGKEYWQVASCLGIDSTTMEHLQSENCTDTRKLIFKMLLKWRQVERKSDAEMFHDLKQALIDCDRRDLAHDMSL